MAERDDLLASIASTIKDYRAGEIAEPTPEHVDRWISQFDGGVQVPMLRELDHVFKRTYYSRDKIVGLLTALVKHPPNRSTQSPCSFWQRTRILNIQQSGESQDEIRNLFGGVLHYECGLNIEQTDTDGQTFVYLDDAVFTGNRVIQDLSAWMAHAPSKATVYICVMVSHSGGEYWSKTRIAQIAADAGNDIDLRFWQFSRFENRKFYRDSAEVLWPIAVPDDVDVRAYLANAPHQFELRRPGVQLRQAYFSSEEGRQLLEREFLRTGIQIHKAHNQVSQSLKPLGFSNFEPGFGSLLVFFRNCPNNCPLALWWSLGNWYPLFPRKTYAQ